MARKLSDFGDVHSAVRPRVKLRVVKRKRAPITFVSLMRFLQLFSALLGVVTKLRNLFLGR